MPINADFVPIKRNFMRTHCGDPNKECPVGQEKYHEWLNSKGLDDSKPLPQKGFGESFAWLANLEPMLQKAGKQNLIKIDAIHEVCTRNRNCYDWNEIANGFASLQGKPVDYWPMGIPDFHGDLFAQAPHPQVVGEVVFARPNPRTRSGEALASVEPHVYELVRSHEIQTASIVALPLGGEFVDAEGKEHIRYPIFTRIALLPKGALPGDPLARVQVLEQWLPVFESFHGHSVAVDNRNSGIAAGLWLDGGGLTKQVRKEMVGEVGTPPVQSGSTTQEVKFEDLHFIGCKIGPVKEAVLGSRARANLPASAFADPKNRKYPHHFAGGELDLSHLRNANARAAQQNESSDITGHLERHKKEAKIGEFAEAEHGVPGPDGKCPEGFTLRGDRCMPATAEAWIRYMGEERYREHVGALQEAFEEEMASTVDMTAEAVEKMRGVANLVGTFKDTLVTNEALTAKCSEMTGAIKEATKDMLRTSAVPVLVKEAVQNDRLVQLESAADLMQAIEGLENTHKLPHMGYGTGGYQMKVAAYRSGFRAAIEELLKLLGTNRKNGKR